MRSSCAAAAARRPEDLMRSLCPRWETQGAHRNPWLLALQLASFQPARKGPVRARPAGLLSTVGDMHV